MAITINYDLKRAIKNVATAKANEYVNNASEMDRYFDATETNTLYRTALDGYVHLMEQLPVTFFDVEREFNVLFTTASGYKQKVCILLDNAYRFPRSLSFTSTSASVSTHGPYPRVEYHENVLTNPTPVFKKLEAKANELAVIENQAAKFGDAVSNLVDRHTHVEAMLKECPAMKVFLPDGIRAIVDKRKRAYRGASKPKGSPLSQEALDIIACIATASELTQGV